MAHDQLWKELLNTFFREFFECFFPAVAARLDFSAVEVLDKELFTDVPEGLLRKPDFIARVQTLDGQSELVLIHIEVQKQRQKEFGARMSEYFMLLRLRFRLPVFPVVVYLERGSGGLGTERYQESVFDVPVLTFNYQRVGVPDLEAEEIDATNPLVYGLAALMKRGRKSKAQHKADCLLQIARAVIDEARKSLLVNCVETYLPLSENEQQDFDKITQKPNFQEVTQMQSVYETRGEARGVARGIITGKRETALMLLQVKFGELPPAATLHVQEMTDPAKLDRLTAGILTADTLAELGLPDKESDHP